MAGHPLPFVNAFDHPMVNSLRYNVAQYGSPIAIIWGTQRASSNVLDGFGYHSSGAAKGGIVGGKGKGQASVNVALGFCVGPIQWNGGNATWANAGIKQLSATPLNWYPGYDGQAPDPTFSSSSPHTPVVGYSGLAYATGTPMQLSGGVLPNFSAEVTGFRAGTAGNNPEVSPDASPALIVFDMLFDPRVGIGFPGATFTTFPTWQNFCQAAMLGFSLICDRQQPLKSWIEELCLLTTSAPFWSSGRFRILPYSTRQFDANGAAYFPDLTPVAFLTDKDFAPWTAGRTRQAVGEKDPVLVKRSDVSTLTNWLTIEILNRPYWYDSLVQPPFFDQASVEQHGVRTSSSVQAHEVCTQDVGGQVTALMMARKFYLRNTFMFRLGWQHMLLEPMDIVALTDPGAGLTQYPVRLIEIVEDDGGYLTMTAEDLIS